MDKETYRVAQLVDLLPCSATDMGSILALGAIGVESP